MRIKARGRQLLYEIDNCVYPPTRRIVEQLILRQNGEDGAQTIKGACGLLQTNLEMVSITATTPFLLGKNTSFVDFALYPLVAMLDRIHALFPGFSIGKVVPEPLKKWQVRVEALTYFEKTRPPHWI